MTRARSETGQAGYDGSLTAKLIADVRDLITLGSLAPGEKLPPERELAKRFGVNRTSLRHALKVLQMIGVVSQRVGDGTYLSDSAEAVLHIPIEFMVLLGDITSEELMDARIIVEPELAARAAARSSGEDLQAMRRAITMLGRSKTVNKRIEADSAFHDAILRASGNRVCRLLFSVVNQTTWNMMRQSSKRTPLDRPLQHHRLIYAAIEARDPEKARIAMSEHLRETRTGLNAAS